MIVVKIMGGLGNQLFQYAFALAMKEKGNSVYLDKRTWWKEIEEEGISCIKREYHLDKIKLSIRDNGIQNNFFYFFAHRFPYNLIKVLNDYIGRLTRYRIGYKLYNLEEVIEYDSEILRHYHYNCYFSGYFQSYKYFSDISERIKAEIQLKNNKLVELEGTEDLVTVALHIRRGDYVDLGRALNVEYYMRGINYIIHTVKNPIFYIFTDDFKWCKMLDVPYNNVFINETKEMTDFEELIIMSKCHHFIISNSTYSWWGAWLSDSPDKIVVCPDGWGNEDIIPSNWIRL